MFEAVGSVFFRVRKWSFSTIIVQVIAERWAKASSILTWGGGVEGPERTYVNNKKGRDVKTELLEDRNDQKALKVALKVQHMSKYLHNRFYGVEIFGNYK